MFVWLVGGMAILSDRTMFLFYDVLFVVFGCGFRFMVDFWVYVCCVSEIVVC